MPECMHNVIQHVPNDVVMLLQGHSKCKVLKRWEGDFATSIANSSVFPYKEGNGEDGKESVQVEMSQLNELIQSREKRRWYIREAAKLNANAEALYLFELYGLKDGHNLLNWRWGDACTLVPPIQEYTTRLYMRALIK